MSDHFHDPLPGSGVSFWGIMACAAGALMSMRTVAEAGPWARAASGFSAFALAMFLGPAIAEHFELAPDGNKARAIMLLVAFVGVNFLAGVAVFGSKFRADPRDAVAWLMSIFVRAPK